MEDMTYEDQADVEGVRYRDAFERDDLAAYEDEDWSAGRVDVCRECGEPFERGDFARRLCVVCIG